MQFVRSTQGMEDAKKYLLQKMFGGIPDALEFKTLHEVLATFEAAARKNGGDLGKTVNPNNSEHLRSAHYFVIDMLESLGGVNRNAIHEPSGAVRIYGSHFGTIESTALDTLANYYENKFSMADIEEILKPEAEKPMTYLQEALVARRGAVNSTGNGMRKVLGADYDIKELAHYDHRESLKAIHDLTLQACRHTGFNVSLPTNINTFKKRLENPDAVGRANTTDYIQLGILIAFAVQAHQTGVPVENIIEQAVKDGKFTIKQQPGKKPDTTQPPGLWTDRTEPQDFGR